MIALALAVLWPLSQEKDNPQFTYWAAWKPGAWTKSKMEMEQNGQKVDMQITAKLLEVFPDKLVVESSGVMKIKGQEIPSPSRKQEIKLKDEKMGKIEKEGDEDVEIAGKKLACHWVEFTQDQQGKKMTARIWLAKEVPGGVAKTEMYLDGSTTPTMKMQAIEWGDK